MGADAVVYDVHRFAPASPAECHVYGSCSPGWHAVADRETSFDDWLEFMRGRDVRRVCSLLPASDGPGRNNLSEFRDVFGAKNVLHAPIADGHLPTASALREEILPFLAASRDADERVVVAGLAGIGRVGVVLSAWLVAHRGQDPEAAIATVESVGRDPGTVLERGASRPEDLHALLASLQ